MLVSQTLINVFYYILIFIAVIGFGTAFYFLVRVDWRTKLHLHRSLHAEINPNRPMHEIIGKLIKKTRDERTPKQMKKAAKQDTTREPEDAFYYLKFETYSGYRTFRVTKEMYSKYRTNTYGIVYHQGPKFARFEVRSRNSLGITNDKKMPKK